MILIPNVFDKYPEIEQNEVLLEVKFILQLLDGSRYVNLKSECANSSKQKLELWEVL